MTQNAARREPSNPDYDALFELTTSPTLEVDAAGIVLRCNSAAARLLEEDPRTVRGTALDVLLGTDVTEAIGADNDVELEVRTPGGPVPVVARSMRRSLQASDGDRFTLQLERLRQSEPNDSRRRAGAAAWSMMDDASHNLGTPLAIVAGYAETLAARIGEMSPEHVATAASAMHRHASRAIDELHAIQARARLSTGGAGTVPTSVLVAWLRRMLDANLVANGAVLVGRHETELITIDVAVARQALLNVCTAVLHSVDDGAVIELGVDDDDDGTVFRVTSDPEVVTFVEPADTILAATRVLVEEHGGRFDRPTEQHPTHVVRLPSHTHGEDREAAPTIPVAVIEDDPDTAALIRASLENSSAVFDVVADARTFAEGLAAVAACQPRIVLLDRGLPDRDGATGVGDLVEVAPGSQVVVLSARGPDDADEVRPGTTWLEKGHVLADLGSELIAVLASR